ncbi:hypothetical protein [Polaribacter sp. R77954]|uniref:hypothetical protein n=1 Tax=Polaribacter sp. R77954 TaxID=3093870 RepID=UPI0037C7C82F
MKQLNTLFLICFCLLAFQCSKNEANQAPTAVSLIYPSENLLCIDNTITFNWSTASDPENDKVEYNIIIAKDRNLTNIIENRTISNTQLTVSLEQETAYYWKVDALDVTNDLGTASETYAFFTQGETITNYVPFTSAPITPENNSQVNSNTVNLTWDAADANSNDTLTYEVYFGETGNISLQDDTVSTKSFLVSVVSGKTYSWRVDVKDQNGAKSIGHVWTFSVN